MMHYDAVVIGTGQAGKPLAGAFAEAGWKTAIIERGRVGGTCVIEGCTPTKTMVASARVAYLARRAGDYGVSTGPVTVDMEVIRKRKRDIVDSWSGGSTKGMTRHETLELVYGEASFTGPRALAVRTPEGDTLELTADKVFVNVGLRARRPDLVGMDSVPYLDNASVMELGEVPEHLVVLGGGFIGLEFGQMFRRFGAEVTVLEQAPTLAPREDEDIGRALHEILLEDGITVELGAHACEVSPVEDGGVELVYEQDGARRSVIGSHLLVAAGRTSNADTLNLEAAGLEMHGRGFISVNDRLETNVDGVWALGDVNGGPPFTHIAYDDYRIVRDNLLGEGGASRAGRLLPYTVFTDPQLGRVGMTEREARDEGYEVRVAKLPMNRVARAIEMDETRGLMKAVVDAKTGLILGAAVLGVEGGEIATVVQMAMLGDLPYTALKDGVFAHPTLAESLNNLFMAMDA
jgi:pyruvate/2-oxoglutarate dehydrogenase complex dihydrolipoamide dehydrogenase (E3) component